MLRKIPSVSNRLPTATKTSATAPVAVSNRLPGATTPVAPVPSTIAAVATASASSGVSTSLSGTPNVRFSQKKIVSRSSLVFQDATVKKVLASVGSEGGAEPPKEETQVRKKMEFNEEETNENKEISSPVTPGSPIRHEQQKLPEIQQQQSVSEPASQPTTEPASQPTAEPEPQNNTQTLQLTWRATAASHVLVTGDFWQWQKQLDMVRVRDDLWVFDLEDPPFAQQGQPTKRYEYKFIVDGQWMCDVTQDHAATDGKNWNNFIYL